MTAEPARTVDAPGDAAPAACQVCAHSLVAHDPIGLRFCRATQTQALTRNCICRVT